MSTAAAADLAPVHMAAGSMEAIAGDAFLAACTLDVVCLKPGNVSVESPGHGMRARDFIASARAAVGPICDPAATVGERILGAVRATRGVVGCNTNLGIVLLAAPLLHAFQRRAPGTGLRVALDATLAGLDVDDAALAYRAIRLAAPAGLGRVDRYDVSAEPAVTLLEAMREAAPRDRVARQYADGYAEVWGDGIAALRQGRERWRGDAAAVACVYLGFLASAPDSHVVRKHGAGVAAEVERAGRACVESLRAARDWAGARAGLARLDRDFKERGINPGTSADLTVAVLLADRLEMAAPAG
jgi:triphosphoribosyl-dephospho-CoA synthase